MIQKNPKQTFPSFITQSKKLTDLLVENQRLESELYKWKQDYRKLQGKYQKSLKQLALIVKANETLKKDYDELQSKIDSIVQQKAQITRSKIKQYIKKEIDDLNKTIQKLNDQKDQLEIENNSLNNKVKTLGMEKTKILKEKEEYQRKYNILEAQLEGIDPQARDQNAKSESVKNLKEKARLVDELQQAVHKLQQQKQLIQKDFDEKLNQIESLWHQWYDFQHQINQGSQNNEIKLHDQKSQPQSQQKDQQKSPPKKSRRKGSIIYEHGIKLIRGDKQPQKGQKKEVHFIHELEQSKQKLQQMKQRVKTVQKEKQNLLTQIENLKKTLKQSEQLKATINKLKEEKQNAQQKVSQLRIQLISKQATGVRMNGSNISHSKNETNILLSPDQDLVSILKDLHSQLGPLRSQLISMKRQQSQQSQITSTEKANIEVKLIRLEKQLTFYKDHNEVLKKQLLQMKSQKQLITEYESKINELETQKSALQGKLIVMQTLKIADRTRVEGDTFNSLKQFQKRMQILAHDSTILKDLEGNHLQQLIAMKAYILQLDERMKMLQLENAKITKKYAYVKQKLSVLNLQIKQLQGQQSNKMTMYRQKLSAYDKLVSKLTAELQKNIQINSRLTTTNNNNNTTRQSRKHNNGKIITTTQQLNQQQQQSTSQSQQLNKIMNLYEQKMINMGEQILRVRKDRDDFEGEVKQLRYKLNVKIRELNEKERELVVVKMEVIGLQNERGMLQREVVEMRSVANNNGLQKQHIVGNNNNSEYQINQLHKQQNQAYQSQLNVLKQQNNQLQQQIFDLKHHHNQNKQQLNKKPSSQKDQYQQQQQQQVNTIVDRIRKQYEQQQLASVQLLIQKHNELIHQIRHKHFMQLRQKDHVIQKLQHTIYQLQQQLKSTQENIQQIDNQSPLVHQNMQLHNDLYEKNVKITSLEAVIYNLKLEKQRLVADYQMLSDRMDGVQEQLRIKKGQLYDLQNELRNASNIRDSTILAKDSLIKSYENEIKNLKWTIDDLKGINVMEKQELQKVIEALREKLLVLNYDGNNSNNNNNNSYYQPHVNVSRYHGENHVENQQQQSPSSSSSQEIEETKQFILQLQQKVTTLQSQLKYTQQQLLMSSEQINRLSGGNNINNNSNINNNNSSSNKNTTLHPLPSSNSSIMSLSNYQKMQLLQTQVLMLRTNILSLQNEIEYKEQVINQLRQDIFNMKMQHLKISNNGGGNENSVRDSVRQQENNNHNHNHNHNHNGTKQHHTQYQHQTIHHVDRSTSPRKSPIFMITDQPIIAGLQYRLDEIQRVNNQLRQNNYQLRQKSQQLEKNIQQLVRKLGEKEMQVVMLQTEMERLNWVVGKYKKEEGEDRQNEKDTTNNIKQQQIQHQQQHHHQHKQAIHQQKIYYQSQINQLHNTIKQYETQILNKNIKISQLNRQIVQYRLMISGGGSGNNSKENVSVNNYQQQMQQQQKQHEQKQQQQRRQQQKQQQHQHQQHQHNDNNIQYLLQQIQRQQFMLNQKQQQLTDIQTILTKYQSQQNRQKENLSLILLLMVEIQSLRTQLMEKIKDQRRQKGESIDSNKILRVKEDINKERKLQQQKQDKVDYSVIKGVECSHQHLVNYQKIVLTQKEKQKHMLAQQQQKQQQQQSQKKQEQQHQQEHQHEKQHPITQTIITNKSRNQLPPIPYPLTTHQRTSSLQKQHIPTSSYKTIDEMKLIEAQSFPSESNSSINNIDSNYSIRNPFKDYYRHAESTYNPLAFSPEQKDSIGEDDGEKHIQEVGQKNVVQQGEIKSKHLMGLGSFGKISQSHNVESSYGSMGLQSNQYLSQRGDPSNSEYNYNFKNVNMIQSIESTPKEKGKKQVTQQKQQQKKQDKFNNFSFGKEEKFRKQPLSYQVESRYVFEKRDEPVSSSIITGGTVYGNQPYSSYGLRQNYSSSYLQQYPITSTNSPYIPATTTLESFPSFNSKNTLINNNKSNSYISQQHSQRSGSQHSSNNYIPTYNSNSGSSSFISNNNLNYGTTSGTNFSNLSQNNYNSTLENTTSTYQQYMSKFL